jgi:hypothetical protein
MPKGQNKIHAPRLVLSVDLSPGDIPSHVIAMHWRRHPPIRLGSVDNSNANTCADGIPIMNF